MDPERDWRRPKYSLPDSCRHGTFCEFLERSKAYYASEPPEVQLARKIVSSNSGGLDDGGEMTLEEARRITRHPANFLTKWLIRMGLG